MTTSPQPGGERWAGGSGAWQANPLRWRGSGGAPAPLTRGEGSYVLAPLLANWEKGAHIFHPMHL